jgi:hypothetical protein
MIASIGPLVFLGWCGVALAVIGTVLLAYAVRHAPRITRHEGTPETCKACGWKYWPDPIHFHPRVLQVSIDRCVSCGDRELPRPEETFPIERTCL